MTAWGRTARFASPYLLAAMLGGSGALHLLRPAGFDSLIPPFLPNPRAWTYASGVVELACAAAVTLPRARRVGALASAVLLVAVFPGNIYMAIEPGATPRWLAVARLPLQVPLVLWALQVANFFPSTGRGAHKGR